MLALLSGTAMAASGRVANIGGIFRATSSAASASKGRPCACSSSRSSQARKPQRAQEEAERHAALEKARLEAEELARQRAELEAQRLAALEEVRRSARQLAPTR